MHACLFVRWHTESSFYHCQGPVKVMQDTFGVRKNVESIFHHCGGPAKLVHPSWSVQRDPKSHSGGCVKLWHGIFSARKT